MKSPLGRLAGFLERLDHYEHYRTRREASFARGTVAGFLAALVLRAAWLAGALALAPAAGFGRGFLLPFLDSAVACLLPGMLLGCVLALREPRWTPVAGSLTAPPEGEVSPEALEAARRAWAREDAWLPLDGRLRSGRPPVDRLGLTAGGSPLQAVVAAENAEAAEASFACTTWFAPGDARNAVWFSATRSNYGGQEADAAGFRDYFSEEAVQARWDSLPAEARRAAEREREELLARARAYAAGRREAIDALGDGAGDLPMLAARRLGDSEEEFAAALVLHEAGHLRLAAWCGSPESYAREGSSWESRTGRALRAAFSLPVSLYSLVTPSECFAEHYAAWRLRPTLVPAALVPLLEAVAFGGPLPGEA